MGFLDMSLYKLTLWYTGACGPLAFCLGTARQWIFDNKFNLFWGIQKKNAVE